jgi:hypothetical protein
VSRSEINVAIKNFLVAIGVKALKTKKIVYLVLKSHVSNPTML